MPSNPTYLDHIGSALLLIITGVCAPFAYSKPATQFVYSEVPVATTLWTDLDRPDNPPIDLATFRSYNHRAAAAACSELLGEHSIFRLLNESSLEQSKITYTLSATYFCGRDIQNHEQLLPHVIHALSLSQITIDDRQQSVGYIAQAGLEELATKHLITMGNLAALELLDVASNPNNGTELQIKSLRILGRFLNGEGTLSGSVQRAVLGGIVPLCAYTRDFSPTSMVAAEAASAFAEIYSAAFHAKRFKPQMSDLTYAHLLYVISNKWNWSSSYAVAIAELTTLLGSDTLVNNFVLSSFTERGLSETEFLEIRPLLTAYANPQHELRDSSVFKVLNLWPSPENLELIVGSLDPSLVTDELSNRNFLFQALGAVKGHLRTTGIAATLPGLRGIVAAANTPIHDSLRAFALDLIAKIEGQ